MIKRLRSMNVKLKVLAMIDVNTKKIASNIEIMHKSS